MEELRACYVVSDSVAAALEPYIIFPDFARFERRADSISVVGQGTLDNPRIISAVDSSRTFFDRNIEAFQQLSLIHI